MPRGRELRRFSFVALETLALLALLVFAGTASACPINSVVGVGNFTKPFKRGDSFLFSTGNGVLEDTETLGTNSCTGLHTLDVPDPERVPNDTILFAVAGMGGFTSIFFGSSASGTMQHTYQYDVGCGPCPAGTPIDLDITGSMEWLQFAASVGVLKLTGSAISTLSGSVQVDPFVGSPFNVGPVPATIASSAGFGSSTAGSEVPQSTPLSSTATKMCPLSPQTVRIDLTATASRTGGATTAIARFDKLDVDLSSSCLCPADEGPTVQTSTTSDSSADPGASITPPTPLGCLAASTPVEVDEPSALLALGDGTVLLTESTVSSDLTALLAGGPQTEFVSFDGSTVSSAGFSSAGLGLVSSIVRGTQAGSGPFATNHLVAVEATAWDPTGPFFESATEQLVLIDEFGAVSSLALSEPLVFPGGLAFAKAGGGHFGDDLIVAQAGAGKLATVDSSGTVTIQALGFDFGSPIDLASAPEGGAFSGKLFVADVGSREANGALTNGSGRILVVDETTGSVDTFATGLNAPVAIGFGENSFFEETPSADRLYVLSAGTVDPTTGKVDPGTGTLRAYNTSAASTSLIEDYDLPYDFAFRESGQLVVGSHAGLTEVTCSSAVPALPPGAWGLLLAALGITGALGLARRT